MIVFLFWSILYYFYYLLFDFIEILCIHLFWWIFDLVNKIFELLFRTREIWKVIVFWIWLLIWIFKFIVIFFFNKLIVVGINDNVMLICIVLNLFRSLKNYSKFLSHSFHVIISINLLTIWRNHWCRWENFWCCFRHYWRRPLFENWRFLMTDLTLWNYNFRRCKLNILCT